MTLLFPAALYLGLLAGPILLLYMFKIRRQEAAVSSIMLWQKLLLDRLANTPWQRLRRHLLLIMQLLILAALVMAMAHPALPIPALASSSSILLLDGSASMNAVDGNPEHTTTRFEAARRLALQIVDSLPASAQVTLILASAHPQVLATSESSRSKIRQALEAASPGQEPTDWETAFALAAGAISHAADSDAEVLLLSDGGIPAGLPTFPGPIKYIPVGTTGENLALSALALRENTAGVQLFASVTNYGSLPHEAIVSTYVNDQLWASQTIALSPGETRPVIYENMPGEKRRYTVRLAPAAQNESPLDAFSLDDSAKAVYESTEKRVLLVTPGNFFLEQALNSLPGIKTSHVLPNQEGSIQLPEQGYDLYVFDRLTPPQLPGGNILFLAPGSNQLFQVTGVISPANEAQVVPDPLTQYINWDSIHVQKAQQVLLPGWARPLITTPQGPLVFAGEEGQRRIAALAFNITDSDLPLQAVFPILVSNLVSYLSNQPSSSMTGQTSENLFSPLESTLRPAQAINLGQATIPATQTAATGWREIWPWMALSALILMMVEWSFDHHNQFTTQIKRLRRMLE